MTNPIVQHSNQPRDGDRIGVVASISELIALREPSGLAASRAAICPAGPGNHVSIQHGRGMEFAEVRPYQTGDDLRAVDWRHTARRGRLYTKLFHEEHDRPVRILVDLSASMRFGTRGAFKSVVAARAAAWLAWRAIGSGDRLGGVVWSGDAPCEIPPQRRQHGALTLLRRIADATATPPSTPAGEGVLPLHTLVRPLRAGSLNVIISDFATISAEVERQIVALAGCADLMLIHLYDIFEAQPPPGRYRITDGQQHRLIDLLSDTARREFSATFDKRCAMLEKLAMRTGASLLKLATDADLQQLLNRAVSGPRSAIR